MLKNLVALMSLVMIGFGSGNALAANECQTDSDCESNYQCVENTCRLSESSSSDSSVSLEDDGVKMSYSEEKITRVTKKTGEVTLGTWSLNGLYSSVIAGGGFGLGIRYLDPEGSFPGVEGGEVSCLDARAELDGQFISFEMPTFDFSSGYGSTGTETVNSGQVTAGGTLAYTWLNFDKQSPDEVTQSGWGFNVGLKVYYQYSLSDDRESELGWDPVVGLEFVDWNPGTATYDSFNITGFILPIPGAFSANIAMGGTL